MKPWRWSVSQECYVDVDEIHDPKQKEGSHRSVALKSEKPAMEDGVDEFLRPCCNGKAGQENSKLEEQKSQESSEVGVLSFLFCNFYPHLLVIFRQYLLLYLQNDVKL